MTAEISIFVCDSEEKSQEAVAFLTAQGFDPAYISAEQAGVASYDARKWDGGEFDQTLNNWVVIGRR